MKNDEIEIATALSNVNVLPGTWDKKFMTAMSFTVSTSPNSELTDKQRFWLFRLCYKYRAQIPEVYMKYSLNPLSAKVVKFEHWIEKRQKKLDKKKKETKPVETTTPVKQQKVVVQQQLNFGL